MQFEFGNASEKSAISADGIPNGWFVGSRRFIEDFCLRQNEHCEIKWSVHPKGFDSGIKPCASGWGISILVSGDFWIAVRDQPDSDWQECRLSRPGDFLISHGGDLHRYRAEADSVLVTFRLTLPSASE
jgi:hypothetical protein